MADVVFADGETEDGKGDGIDEPLLGDGAGNGVLEGDAFGHVFLCSVGLCGDVANDLGMGLVGEDADGGAGELRGPEGGDADAFAAEGSFQGPVDGMGVVAAGTDDDGHGWLETEHDAVHLDADNAVVAGRAFGVWVWIVGLCKGADGDAHDVVGVGRGIHVGGHDATGGADGDDAVASGGETLDVRGHEGGRGLDGCADGAVGGRGGVADLVIGVCDGELDKGGPLHVGFICGDVRGNGQLGGDVLGEGGLDAVIEDGGDACWGDGGDAVADGNEGGWTHGGVVVIAENGGNNALDDKGAGVWVNGDGFKSVFHGGPADDRS